MEQASISLCMIVKDEEDYIAQCIRSVQSLVDEIIVVDTGSTDRTVEIAKQEGAKIYFFEWNNDFSKARNFSLSKATSDWILILDADEAIHEKDHNLIKTLVGKKAAYELTQRHYTNDHRISKFSPVVGEFPEFEKEYKGYFESGLTRLFPNDKNIKFRGKVHELVEHSLNDIKKYPILKSEIIIHHYGHTPEILEKKDKGKLYKSLGESKLENSDLPWQSHFELGVEYNRQGELEKSIKEFLNAIALNPQYLSSWINIGYVLCEAQKYAEAEKALKTAICLDKDASEAYCNLGVVYLRTEKYSEAARAFQQAIDIRPNYVNAYCNLGKALCHMGKISEAVLVYMKILSISHRCETALLDLSAIYLQVGMVEEAEKYLKEAEIIKADSILLNFYKGTLLKVKGNIEEARSVFKELESYLDIKNSGLSDQMKEEIRKSCV